MILYKYFLNSLSYFFLLQNKLNRYNQPNLFSNQQHINVTGHQIIQPIRHLNLVDFLQQPGQINEADKIAIVILQHEHAFGIANLGSKLFESMLCIRVRRDLRRHHLQTAATKTDQPPCSPQSSSTIGKSVAK